MVCQVGLVLSGFSFVHKCYSLFIYGQFCSIGPLIIGREMNYLKKPYNQPAGFTRSVLLLQLQENSGLLLSYITLLHHLTYYIVLYIISTKYSKIICLLACFKFIFLTKIDKIIYKNLFLELTYM